MSKTYYYLIFIALLSLMMASACANRGAGPQGGKKDETPPRLIKSQPAEGEKNFTKTQLEILFDEIVQVQGAAEKVVVSPPQQTPPTVKSVGRKVTVKLNDSLELDASYTIDFSNAIVDNNEKNELENFSLSFSTGDVIDSLQISGTVLDASNLNPIKGVIVGIHSDLTDTAFTKKVFRRITKTDEKGRFTVRNIKQSKYKVYALQDVGSNYRFDYPNELIAFNDSILETSVSKLVFQDTVWMEGADALKVDTITQRVDFDYQPKNIILFAFIEDTKRQYLKKTERKERYHFSLQFAKSLDSIPTLKALNFDLDSSVVMLPSETMDTLNYWILDSVLLKQDTLITTVEYYKTDSLNNNVLSLDTITFAYRPLRTNRKQQEKKNLNDTIQRVEFISFETNISQSHDFFVPPTVKFIFPTSCADLSMCRIEEKVDTVWRKIEGDFMFMDNAGLNYTFQGDLKPNMEYKLVVDSLMFFSVDGKYNDKKEIQFRTKALEVYGLIKVELQNYEGKERLQLLDKNDNVLREIPIENGTATFQYLMPSDYYMRLFIDDNGDGKWTNGDYSLKRYPEEIYYFPYSITVRAFWDVEEKWNYKELPVNEQKPLDLIKDTSK